METTNNNESLFESIAKDNELYRYFIEYSTEGIYRVALTEPIDVSLPCEEQAKLYYERAYIADCNKPMLQMYGVTQKEELVGKRIIEFHTDTNSEIYEINFNMTVDFCRNQYRIVNLESFERDLNGNEVYFLNTAIGIIEDGLLRGVWGTQNDITQIKKAQKVLAQNNKELEEQVSERSRDLLNSNRRLEAFAYAVSHDLKEPVRNIVSHLQLLERSLHSKLTETEKEHLNFAVNGGKRIYETLGAILDYSQITNVKQQTARLDLNKILHDVISIYEKDIKNGNIEILSSNLPAVNGNPVQLTRLLQNLIGNAIKFSQGYGSKIFVSGVETDKRNVISVADNGIGIDPKYHKDIFNMFKRLHPREEYPGSGIGLSTCKDIVESHGGNIWVDSVPGQGSVFYFSLPK